MNTKPIDLLAFSPKGTQVTKGYDTVQATQGVVFYLDEHGKRSVDGDGNGSDMDWDSSIPVCAADGSRMYGDDSGDQYSENVLLFLPDNENHPTLQAIKAGYTIHKAKHWLAFTPQAAIIGEADSATVQEAWAVATMHYLTELGDACVFDPWDTTKCQEEFTDEIYALIGEDKNVNIGAFELFITNHGICEIEQSIEAKTAASTKVVQEGLRLAREHFSVEIGLAQAVNLVSVPSLEAQYEAAKVALNLPDMRYEDWLDRVMRAGVELVGGEERVISTLRPVTQNRIARGRAHYLESQNGTQLCSGCHQPVDICICTVAEQVDADVATISSPDIDGDVEHLDEPDDNCSGPKGHEWEYTGTQYGGDDERYHGEGRCYCIHCGADGDA